MLDASLGFPPPAPSARASWRGCARRLAPAVVAVLLPLAPGAARAQEEISLPEITVQEQKERAGGPVDGYRATRSSTFTKTDLPLQEVPPPSRSCRET